MPYFWSQKYYQISKQRPQMLLILHTVITISYVYIKINKNKKIIFNLLIPGTLAAQGPRQDPTLDRLPFHCRHTHTHIHTPLRLGQFSTLYQYFNFFLFYCQIELTSCTSLGYGGKLEYWGKNPMQTWGEFVTPYRQSAQLGINCFSSSTL